MRFTVLVCTMLAVSLVSGGPALAQGDGQRNDRGDPADTRYYNNGQRVGPAMNRGQTQRAEREQDRRNRWEAERRDQRRDQGRDGYRGDYRGDYRSGYQGDRRGVRGAGPNRAYWRGDRLPMAYRQQIYVVDDWRGHRLSAPPYGQHWVQSGGDYLLVAIATGLILSVILAN